MNKHFIVTIGREFGTGGRKIATELAELLGVPLYDRQVLEPIREGRNLTHEDLDQIKSVKPSFWYGNVSQDLYNEEEKIVRELADKESCVIMGRTGFHIFRDDERAFKVFLMAGKKFRISQVAQEENIDMAQAEQLIEKVDEAREKRPGAQCGALGHKGSSTVHCRLRATQNWIETNTLITDI